MRTVTISMRPQRPSYNLRVMQDEGAANYLQDWRKQRGARHLSAVVGEGRALRIGLFEGEALAAVTSLSVAEGGVVYNGERVLPVIGATWHSLCQDVHIVPSLFPRKEK